MIVWMNGCLNVGVGMYERMSVGICECMIARACECVNV